MTIVNDDNLDDDVPHKLGPGQLDYLCAKMPHAITA